MLRIIGVLNLRLIIKPASPLQIGLRLNTSLLDHGWWTSACWLRNSTVILSNHLHRLRFIDWRELNTFLGLNLSYFSTLSLHFWWPRIGNTRALNVHFSILSSSIDYWSRDPFSNDFWGTFLRGDLVSIFNFLGQ